MTVITALLTADDLLNLPPDNMRHELVKGELTTMAPTSDEHGIRTGRVTLRIGDFVDRHNLGAFFGAETGFIISRNPDTVRAPDFAFVAKDRMTKRGITKRFFPEPPDMAVEVLSPSDSASEVLEKMDEWLAAGTRLIWLVDPEKKTVRVFAPKRSPQILSVADTLDGEDVIPGLRIAVAEIFR